MILIRDTVRITEFYLSTSDTIIVDTSVGGGTLYNYHVEIHQSGEIVAKSNQISVETKMPTSNTFQWESFVFGGGDDSFLRDVFIVDERNIWAVGEISTRDSVGNIINPPYNIMHSGNDTWDFASLSFQYDFGSGYSDAVAVYGFSPNEIVVSSGGSVMNWNGTNWNNLGFLSENGTSIGSVFRLWGTSSSDLYGGSQDGRFMRWRGITWSSIESGTSAGITDIIGFTNPINNLTEVYGSATDFLSTPRKILKLDMNDKVDSIRWDKPYGIASIWTGKGVPLYAATVGIAKYVQPSWTDFLTTNIPISKIRGDGLNNIACAGSLGRIWHFNGVDWKEFTISPGSTYYSIAIKGDLIVAVGRYKTNAILTIGKRLNQ